MAKNQPYPTWVYTTSLVAAFLIGLDCFVIGLVFLYPFLGLLPAIIIAACGWVLNTFVYYKSGPDNIAELVEKEEPRSGWSYVINLIAFLGGVFVLLFTIFAYVSFAATFPLLAPWVTPFFIASMAIAFFIGTFTLNKSELSADFLTNLDPNSKSILEDILHWGRGARDALLQRLAYKKGEGYLALVWRCTMRIVLPILVALIVTVAMTFCFLKGCNVLLVGCGLLYAYPILVVMAVAFFMAEFYFNVKQNIELVDKFCEQSNDKANARSMFSPAMMVITLMALANAIVNGFIAMDAAFIAIGAVAMVKFLTGVVQSFCTMMNTCYSFYNDPEQSFDTLNGSQTQAVLQGFGGCLGMMAAFYCISVFCPIFMPLAVLSAGSILAILMYPRSCKETVAMSPARPMHPGPSVFEKVSSHQAHDLQSGNSHQCQNDALDGLTR